MSNEVNQALLTPRAQITPKPVAVFNAAEGKRVFVPPQIVKQGYVAKITGASDIGGGCDPDTDICDFTP